MSMPLQRQVNKLEEKIENMAKQLPFNYDNFIQLTKKVDELENIILQLSKASTSPKAAPKKKVKKETE